MTAGELFVAGEPRRSWKKALSLLRQDDEEAVPEGSDAGASSGGGEVAAVEEVEESEVATTELTGLGTAVQINQNVSQIQWLSKLSICQKKSALQLDTLIFGAGIQVLGRYSQNPRVRSWWRTPPTRHPQELRPSLCRIEGSDEGEIQRPTPRACCPAGK